MHLATILILLVSFQTPDRAMQAREKRVAKACSHLPEDVLAKIRGEAAQIALECNQKKLVRKDALRMLRKWCEGNQIELDDRTQACLSRVSKTTGLPEKRVKPKPVFKPEDQKLRAMLVQGEVERLIRLERASNELSRAREEYAYEYRRSSTKVWYEQFGVNRAAREVKEHGEYVAYLEHLDGCFLPTISVVDVGSIGVFRSARWSESSLFEPRNYKLTQVVNATEAIMKYDDKVDFWLSGVDTSGTVDDMFIALPNVYEVVGTKQYSTAIGGQRTIFHVAPTGTDLSGLRQFFLTK